MDKDRFVTLRRLIWLYFFLLLFEGALRKWVVPSLSSILLIVRDPVVLLIYVVALKDGAFPRTAYLPCIVILAVACGLASFTGIGSIAITIFGLRADFLHLPLIFIFPAVLRPSDLRQFGFALLASMPFMAILALFQFKSGPDSYWNLGAGGAMQLYAGEGKVRVSGTFSFVSGIVSYVSLIAAFAVDAFFRKKTYPWWLLPSSIPALILTVAISGSRGAVIGVTFVGFTVLYMVIRRPAQFGNALRPVIFGTIAFIILGFFTSSISEGLAVQKDRFEGAGGINEGIIQRTFREYVFAWNALFHTPPLGIGLGIGTNAGASLLTGRVGFTLAESEWERLIRESGPALGLGFVVLRLAISLTVLRAALRAYQRGPTLPLLLVGANSTLFLSGQFGQPTTVGFAIFVYGLALASTEEEKGQSLVHPAPGGEPLVTAFLIPGQSAYARRLHAPGSNGGPLAR